MDTSSQELQAVVLKHFTEQFSGSPLLVQSPGRVNIIGEHTDYNNGFVLPAAIDKGVYIAIAKRNDDELHLFSGEFLEKYQTTSTEVKPTDKGWPNYVLGVVDQLQKHGHKLGGFNLVVDGNVPIGAGLSSSAAVECATAFALNKLFGLRLGKMEIALQAQKAEHEFAGVMCGIMDQFASVFGKKDHVIRLDCQTLEYKYEELQLNGYKLVLLNTNVKHSLASSEYNTRRQQCEQGVAWVKEHTHDVNSLRDVSMHQLNDFVKPKDELIYQRCKYVVEENIRLLDACDALEKGDIATLGEKMFETHFGLSKEYEVSCKELDFLVDYVKDNHAVLGARMMGGGFGGCTINIVQEKAIDDLINDIRRAYQQAMGLELSAYIAQIEDGSHIVSQ